ncbi:peptide methionine sulfoxide reductase, partial [Pontibacter sp. HJ8]
MKKIHTFFLFPVFLLLWSCTESTTERAQLEASSFSYGDSTTDTTHLETATFAGGCFWCTEAYFERLQGVHKVISGYTGGRESKPTYQQVSSGKTGHAEGVQVYYNPAEISYRELLEVFFATHDPTTLNRQGPDVGKQYRSAIFYQNEDEKQEAKRYIDSLEEAGTYRKKIVTEL